MDRAGTTRGHRGKGPVQHFAYLRGIRDAAGGTECCDHRLLVGQLVQEAPARAQAALAVDARYHQHRHRIFACLRHGRDGVGQARPGDDQRHAGFACGAGIAIGHEGAALLVPRGDMPNRTS